MKIFIALLLLIVFIVPVVVCNKVEDLEGVVQIKMLEAGYGTRFMDELISEFKKVDRKFICTGKYAFPYGTSRLIGVNRKDSL